MKTDDTEGTYVTGESEVEDSTNNAMAMLGSRLLKEPSELEKEQHEALIIMIDHFQFPFEVTKGGLTLIRLSPEQVDEIKRVFELFTVIYGLQYKRGKYVKAEVEK